MEEVAKSTSSVGVFFREVRKCFGVREILQKVSLEISPGEFLVLLGPSGSGKSTLLRLLAGLEELSSGEIWIGQKRVDQLPPQKRSVAMVFQDYALYPHMPVWENLTFSLRLQKVSPKERRKKAQEVAQWLGLDKKLDAYPKHLSGGERQRVAIGRAILRSPQVFLFDEPLSNLDAKLRTEMRTQIAKLHRQLNTTSLYVTHDQQEAMTLADRIVVLHRGRIQQLGTPLDLYHHPQNTFVATFLGSPPMNLVTGELKEQQGTLMFKAPSIEIPLPAHWKAHFPPDCRQCQLGIRPEDLQLCSPPQGHAQGQILLIEPLGRDQILYLEGEWGEWALQSPRENSHTRPTETVGLYFPLNKLHFFEASPEGRRIGGGEWGLDD